jgi:hypothetical protein
MPAGQSSWIRRSMGLALSWHLLRRSLALQGAARNAALATVISRPAAEVDQVAARRVDSWHVREKFSSGSPGRRPPTR